MTIKSKNKNQPKPHDLLNRPKIVGLLPMHLLQMHHASIVDWHQCDDGRWATARLGELSRSFAARHRSMFDFPSRLASSCVVASRVFWPRLASIWPCRRVLFCVASPRCPPAWSDRSTRPTSSTLSAICPSSRLYFKISQIKLFVIEILVITQQTYSFRKFATCRSEARLVPFAWQNCHCFWWAFR